MAQEEVVDVALVEPIQAEAEVVQVLVDLPARPKAVGCIAKGVQGYDWYSDISTWQSLQEVLQEPFELGCEVSLGHHVLQECSSLVEHLSCCLGHSQSLDGLELVNWKSSSRLPGSLLEDLLVD